VAQDLASAESLLDFATILNYPSKMLEIHYRSKHPYLIDFSNNAYYQSRLYPFPVKEEYQPIIFEGVDGIYGNQTNEIEANRIIEILKSLLEYPSVEALPSI
jgi:superfamily I DNA and/or RNA helicase